MSQETKPPAQAAGRQDLNPAQKAVLDELGAMASDRPEFDEDLGSHLRAALETVLEPHLDNLPSNEDVYLNKHRLGQVHGCETKFLAEEAEEFEWRVPIARGSVVHKAIELAVHWRRGFEPPTLVDEALARLEAEERGLGHWLQGVSEAERAELRSLAVDSFTKFLECWPPLRPAWRPVTESRLRAELCDGRVILDGKVDLSLGTAHGRTAGKVIVDFKTGTSLPVHREDLRFYAMVETLRIGVPPRMLSSYYLDRGYPISETVSLETLEATVARVADGVGRLIELRHGGRTPNRVPGPPCRWCPAYDDCDVGQAHRAEFDDD